ncbi:MAG: polysaccharide biosynthesis protein [Flavobacteriales bacterium]|nr:polysaccharide biosynthesis protein [Flavobacteriales bacterium]
MSVLKKLAGQTAIYGMSSIVARFLNYLLVPLHTAVFVPQQYGVITEMYAYVAFLIILLTYGMETAFFRFSTKEGNDPKTVFSTILTSLVTSTSAFILMAIIFAQPIADWLMYPDNKEYVVWFAIIVGLDAISSIPLARLRSENRPKLFAGVNIANVAVNVGLNLFFLKYCLPLVQSGGSSWLTDTFYDPNTGVGYVFIANLLASVVKFLLLSPTMFRGIVRPQFKILRPMLVYAFPLLIAGLAGMMNEMFDRVMLKRLLYPTLGESKAMFELGVYGACYKLSIIISLMIQAFRYAAEPFFFSQEKQAGSRELYAKVMTYFVWVLAGAFLFVMLYIDLFKFFIPNEDYWVGLKVVPILLMANIFLGIYYNQSVWYKLTDKTSFGAGLAIFGAVITILLNLIFIPTYGYVASAWATFACYGSMMVVSYLLGRKHYPVPYELTKLGVMLGSAIVFYWASVVLQVGQMQYGLALNVLFLLGYLAVSWLLLKKETLS